MKADDARTLTDTALEALKTSLEEGRSDTLVRFLRAAARFHRYSWGNLLLILAQRPEATRVAGFHTWRSLGRTVRKGEKGIAILAPIVKAARDTVETAREAMGQGSERGQTRRAVWFKVAWVFDVSQTDGEPLPELRSASGDPQAFVERLHEVIRSRGIRLERGGIVGSALGTSSGGTIRIREGLPPAEEFCTLAHELAHELLHQGPDAERGSHAVRETEAEAVAFVVATAVGIDSMGASSDYIQLHQGDAKLLSRSLDRVQRTAARILRGLCLERVMHPPQTGG